MFVLIEIMPIVYAIIVFSVLILAMALLLIAARKRLIPQGMVDIVINGDKENPIKVQPGPSLLTALSEHDIFLPSACGGGGTCAMCTCKVYSGGGDILPTELNHINRKDAEQKVRLSCQVKVRDHMEIGIPEEIFGIKKWECEVVSNYNVASFIKELVVKLPEGEILDFEPGGYIQIDVPEITVDFKNFDISPAPNDPAGADKYKSEWDDWKLWDLQMVNDEPQFRAYSMANHPAEGNIVMLNIRVATPPFDRAKNGWADVNPGVCSSYTFDLKPGDKITISGPYGEFFIKETNNEMIYIGGGAGMAPLRSHLFHLFETVKERDRKISYWYGGRSKRELFYTDHFRKLEEEFDNFNYHIALSAALEEDNWKVKETLDDPNGDGFTGFIHQALFENYLKNHPEPEEIEYYLCGPGPMLDACLKMFDELGVPEQNIAFDDFG